MYKRQENAEYDAAIESQGLLELQISKMEATLSNARLIDESQLDSSKVLVHSTAEVKNKSNGAKMKYKLVAQREADLKKGKITRNSKLFKKTKIGNNVVIGSNSTLLPVSITSGTVIGAGSTVTKNINVKGKVVVALGGEPKDKNDEYFINGKNKSKWSILRQEIDNKKRVARSLTFISSCKKQL